MGTTSQGAREPGGEADVPVSHGGFKAREAITFDLML